MSAKRTGLWRTLAAFLVAAPMAATALTFGDVETVSGRILSADLGGARPVIQLGNGTYVYSHLSSMAWQDGTKATSQQLVPGQRVQLEVRAENGVKIIRKITLVTE